MNIPQKRAVALSISLFSVSLITACTDRGNQAGQVGEGKQAKVIEEKYTRESQNLGSVAEQPGKEEVRGQREIVQERTEQIKENIPTIVVGEKKADLNRMEFKDFRALGMTEETARNVVDYRKSHNNRFTSVEELKQVPGIDLEWFARNQNKIGISNQAAGETGKK
ncbi:MAG: helix-hairpin-helix domain-containing protein [Bdellovibrionia bacterium]